MRRAGVVALAVALLTGLASTPPATTAARASAVAAMTGRFEGGMSETPGIPALGTCLSNNYTLWGVLEGGGAEVGGSPPHASALLQDTYITVSGSGVECTATGNATAVATCSDSPTYVADVEFPEGADDTGVDGSTTCSLAGSMSRTGTRVVVSLTGTVSVTDPSAATDPTEPATRTYATQVTIEVEYAPTHTASCRGGGICLWYGPVYGTALGQRQQVDGIGPGHPSASAGTVAFNGSATLPSFPCAPPPPYGTGPCSGSFSGQWAGGLSGTSGTSAYSAAWSAPAGSLSAAFQYAEWQCLGGTESVLGFAVGSGTATAQPGQVQGKWQVPGESFARDITAVNVAFSFSWTRVGTSATLVLHPLSVSLDVAGLGTQTVVSDSEQIGSAAFAPTSQSGSGVPTCGNPLADVQGQIAGVVPLGAAAA